MTVQSGKNTVIEEVQSAGKYMDGAANPEVGQLEARDWGAQAGRITRKFFVLDGAWLMGRKEGKQGQGWLLKGCRSHIKELGLFFFFESLGTINGF